MKSFASLTLALVPALVLGGCAGLGEHAPQRYHVLDAAVRAPHAAPAPVASVASVASTLLVSPTTASGFYDSQDIVYSRSAGVRSTYRLNSWTEPPSHRIDALLTERLTRSGAFGHVASAADGVRGALLLSAHLEEIYHDTATSPGTARISLTAVLSDPATRSIAARRQFTASAPVTTPSAAGAVQGFDQALGPLLDDVVAWARSSAAQAPSVQ